MVITAFILLNIILSITTNSILKYLPSGPIYPIFSKTKAMYANILNIANNFLIKINNNESSFDFFIVVYVHYFEIKPLIEADCICVVGKN